MAANKLGLKNYPLKRLKVGQSSLLGPYRSSTTSATMMTKLRQSNEAKYGKWKFVQQQMLLVNPVTCETEKMYLLTRIS